MNWYSIASGSVPENRNPCSTYFTRVKKHQEMIRMVGNDLKQT